jgi:neutral ceramidase
MLLHGAVRAAHARRLIDAFSAGPRRFGPAFGLGAVMFSSQFYVLCLALWLSCCVPVGSQPSSPADPSRSGVPIEFRVGGAYGDLTPDRAMPNYNGDLLEPDESASPLRIHAIVLSDGITRAAIISVDCTFLGRAEVTRIREVLQQRVGLKPDHVCIAATHTHAAPATTASFLAGELPDRRYIELLVSRTAEVVEQALSRLESARVVAASIDAPPIGVCRRRVGPNGQVYMTGTEPESASPLAAENPVDRRMQYAVFENFEGRPLAVIVNFACHNNMVSRVFSADMFGRAGDELRSKLGDIATALLAAPCGDVGYLKPGGQRTYPDDRAAGRAIAEAILTSFPSRARNEGGLIKVRSVLRQFADRPYDPAEFVYDNGRGSSATAHERFQRRNAPEEAAVRRNGATQCDVEFQAIAFGDVAFITNPAELFSIYGIKIKKASPYRVTFVASLANGYCGYVPTMDAFQHGGYETYRTVYTSRLSKDSGDLILRESIDLLRAVYAD